MIKQYNINVINIYFVFLINTLLHVEFQVFFYKFLMDLFIAIQFLYINGNIKTIRKLCKFFCSLVICEQCRCQERKLKNDHGQHHVKNELKLSVKEVKI